MWTAEVNKPAFSAMHAILNVCVFPRSGYREHSMRTRVNQDSFFNEVGVTANKGKAELTGWKAIRPNQREEKERKPQTSADNF